MTGEMGSGWDPGSWWPLARASESEEKTSRGFVSPDDGHRARLSSINTL